MVQNISRPRGRPRGFDEGEALGKAIQVFWSRGYDGATVDDLVAAMGVGKPSLYSVFGDKRAVFLRALETYAETKGALAATALLSPPTLRASLAGFLRYCVESATEEGSASGCLLLCVAPLVDDAEVRQILDRSSDALLALLEGRFRDAISDGEIPSDFPATMCASQVLSLALGLTMRARMGTSRRSLLDDAEAGADLVLLPRPRHAVPADGGPAGS